MSDTLNARTVRDAMEGNLRQKEEKAKSAGVNTEDRILILVFRHVNPPSDLLPGRFCLLCT